MSSWIIPIQRAASLLFWVGFAFGPLLIALLAGIGAAFNAEERAVFVALAVFSAGMGATAIGSVFVLFPVLAWVFRGESRPWLDDLADSLGGVPRYPSLFWPIVSPHLDAQIDGNAARITLFRLGGILGPPIPGERRLIFAWSAFVAIDTRAPTELTVGRTLFGSTLRPIPAPAEGLDWTLFARDVAIGSRVAGDPIAQEIVSRLRAYPGRGVASVGKRAEWTGALEAGCSPAATAGVIRDLSALSAAVVRATSPAAGGR